LISNAFQSVCFGADFSFLPLGLFSFTIAPVVLFFGLGPVPIQKEKLSNGVGLAASRLRAATNARDRMKTGATLMCGYGHQCVDGLSLPNPILL
jgi:hypothetical protein